MIKLPYTHTSPTMIGILKYADVFGWEDVTEWYGDTDYGLTQSFKRDNIVLKITWEASYQAKTIIGVQVGEEDIIFLDRLSGSTALLRKAEELLALDKISYDMGALRATVG